MVRGAKGEQNEVTSEMLETKGSTPSSIKAIL